MTDTPTTPDPVDPDPDEPDPDAPETPDLLVTTTRTKDYYGRALVNATPGTSAATDYLARSVVTGNLDYLGRALVA